MPWPPSPMLPPVPQWAAAGAPLPAQQPAQQPAQDPYATAPPGEDQEWWDAFRGAHGGQSPYQYYGGTPDSARRRWTADRDWSKKYYSTYGRAPDDYAWKARWQGGGSYGGGGGQATPQPSWWGQPAWGESGMVDWPGMQPFNVRNMRYLNEVPSGLRGSINEIMQSLREYWPDPLVPPLTYQSPVWSEL